MASCWNVSAPAVFFFKPILKIFAKASSGGNKTLRLLALDLMTFLTVMISIVIPSVVVLRREH